MRGPRTVIAFEARYIEGRKEGREIRKEGKLGRKGGREVIEAKKEGGKEARKERREVRTEGKLGRKES